MSPLHKQGKGSPLQLQVGLIYLKGARACTVPGTLGVNKYLLAG